MAPSFSTALAPSFAVFAVALVLDVLCGEPPNVIHPVAWLGNTASFLLRLAPRTGVVSQFLFGMFVTIVVPASFAMASAGLLLATARWPLLEFAAATVLLKPMFALRALGRAAAQVRDALAAGQISQARQHLRSLCSRDASTLDAPLLVAGTVESLAENTSDSLVAPLFSYVLFGLPGAVFYRGVNTLDAMIGYHGRYEYLGKAAARLDDVLNLIPARLTAGLLVVAGWFSGKDALRGWRVLWRDGGRTESPNAGRPMAAMAGLLSVGLEKKGSYRLGDPVVGHEIATIDAAWCVVKLCSALAVALLAAAIGARHAYLG